MRQTRDDRHGARSRALIVVRSRGGLRIQEALALGERDLDPRRGSLRCAAARVARRRDIGMDAWGWEHLGPWLAARVELPVGPLFCIIDGPTRDRSWSSAGVPGEFRRLAAHAGYGGASRRTRCATRTPSSGPATPCESDALSRSRSERHDGSPLTVRHASHASDASVLCGAPLDACSHAEAAASNDHGII